jgi:chloride channel protein, CIC family
MTITGSWSRQLSRWLDRSGVPDSVVVMLTSILVGAGAGLGSVFFRWLIDQVRQLAYTDFGGLLANIAPYHLIIIPVLGGLISGPIIYRFAREAKGHGVPEVMEAVAVRGGRIRPQVSAVKAITSAVCIGTGGSVGSEGPIAQIGAGLGSTVGQALRLSDDRVRSLVACGAAGGIAAVFNAPIAGAIFALEVILGQLQVVYFGAVVISAVVADFIAHMFLGNERTFAVPEYSLASGHDLWLFALMGLVAAAASVGFSRLLYLAEDLWDDFKVPEWFKPATGAVLLGIIGIISFKSDGFPRVFGVGYETIGDVMFNQLPVQMVLALFFLKLAATIATLGSGGSGGIFAPSLFMGAMMGGVFGTFANRLMPGAAAPVGAFALVGMAAFFSGATHAPMTAILIVFEMTGNYAIILPLMLATVISTLISRIISPESIYTLKLSRRGIHLRYGQDIDVMQGVTVGEAMTTEPDTVPLDMPLTELGAAFERTHHHGFPVLDAAGELAGVVTIRNLEHAVSCGCIEGLIVADIATTENLLVAYPDEPMWRALRRMGARDVSRLPVVAEEGSAQLVGILRRRDIVRAYNSAIVKRAQQQHRAETLSLDRIDGSGFLHVEIPADSPVVGKRIKEIGLPSGALVVSLRRGRRLRVAHGYSVIEANDRLTLFANRDSYANARQILTGEAPRAILSTDHDLRHHELAIPAGATCAGRSLQELQLPAETILVCIRRGEELIVPHGDTVLQDGDVVEVFGPESELSSLTTCLCD